MAIAPAPAVEEDDPEALAPVAVAEVVPVTLPDAVEVELESLLLPSEMLESANVLLDVMLAVRPVAFVHADPIMELTPEAKLTAAHYRHISKTTSS